MGNYVVTLSENGTPGEKMEKIRAHREGIFHLAFSILIFNDRKEVLLQKRAVEKYHSGGLWSNTCCSHPQETNEIEAYAHIRLKEEMGFDCPLIHCGFFDYKIEFENNLTEHERDHVFIGNYNADPVPAENEADDFRWISMDELEKDLNEHPENYSFWLPMVCKLAFAAIQKYQTTLFF